MTHTQGIPEWVPTRDGRRLYAQVLPGPGSATSGEVSLSLPTVVFEAGYGATRSHWAGVQPRVATVARAIVYDRSGLGRSAPDPAGRTLDRMADDLADLLDYFGPGPFVLVGHSAGGPIVRLAASRRPRLLAGIVLVDPMDEATDTPFSARFRRNERIALRIGKVLARLGMLRFRYRSLLTAAPADDVRDDLRREGFTSGVMDTVGRQARTFLDELETWKAGPADVGDIPVTVISGGLPEARAGMPESVRVEANAAHARRAAQSAYGRHVIARHSGHHVPFSEPQLIADEIERLAAAPVSRRKSP